MLYFFSLSVLCDRSQNTSTIWHHNIANSQTGRMIVIDAHAKQTQALSTTNRNMDSAAAAGASSSDSSSSTVSSDKDGEFFLSMIVDEDFLAIEEALSSEDEVEVLVKRKRAPNKERDFVEAHQKLMRDYFNGPESVYDEIDFERRFRISRQIFNRLHDKLVGTDPFIHKRDCFGNLGIHPLVKLVACLRYVSYGDAFDREDENLRLSETSLIKLLPHFCKLVIEEFGGQYLNRCPNEAERATITKLWEGEDSQDAWVHGTASTLSGRTVR
jgi:hypothetical protein